METPVAFIIFNRPDTTKLVFEQIARSRPKKLLVVADGPRSDIPGEDELCRRTRAVIDLIDWDCELLTNFADSNLGCMDRVSSGLTWVFEQVEEAIILEDDCLPHPSFFPYCEELLARYRNEDRVMAISGDCFLKDALPSTDSYYFSRYYHCWGWAGWRRAWQKYDLWISDWERLRGTNWLHTILEDKFAEMYWTEIFDALRAGKIRTWDYQFLFASWLAGGFSIGPRVNLVSNIGFGAAATHTTGTDPAVAALPVYELEFPLVHPANIRWNREIDEFESTFIFKCREGRDWLARNRRRIGKIVRPLLKSLT